MNGLCIGRSAIEITSVINNSLNDGDNLKLNERMENGTGSAGNVAYLLSKWGINTYIASMLGSDDFGEKIKKEYESIGIKLDYLETSYDKETNIDINLINNNTKNSTKISIGNDIILKKASFIIDPLFIYSDGIDLSATEGALDKYPNVKSFLEVNELNNNTQELCRYVNYIIFSEESASLFTGLNFDYNDSATLVNIYSRLKQKYTKAEILINTKEHGCIYAINGEIKIIPRIKVDVVDYSGSLDVFVGAFIYGVIRNLSLEAAITYATIASSFSIAKLTSRQSIPSLVEVTNYYNSKFNTNNNVSSGVENVNEQNSTT